jgi:Tol biopolymer transport system component/serine/threonine protein kinase
MSLAPGTRLGPYEILSPLGAGGMGEVYRANDPRLRRDIAIKVLPSDLSSDPDRLSRFEKEARAASALNHPNIVTIHEIAEAGSVRFLVMELVSGSTLRQLMAAGPMPFRKLLALAAQVADGLARAHAAGIVHRDLKPDNVMVTPDSVAKILDFGLAKLENPRAEGGPNSQLATETRGTEPGVVLGTVGYMSPEQASGRPLDFRSDQFSFGTILYEMAAGQRAFSRATAVETLAAIVREEPAAIGSVRPDTPVPFRWVVERCLAKDPRERYASTDDLARDLATLRDRLPETAAPAAAAPSALRRRTAIAGWALAFLFLGLLLFSSVRGRRTSTSPAGTEATITQLTNYGESEGSGAISPDGRQFAFVSEKGGSPDIWVRQVSGGEPLQITRDEAIETDLVYSPDGESLYYATLGPERPTIWRIPALGGTSRKIVEGARYPSPAADGKRLAYVHARSPDFILWVGHGSIEIGGTDGTGARKLYEGSGIGPISWSPDSHRLAFTQAEFFEARNLHILGVESAREHPVTRFPSGSVDSEAWLPDSRSLVYSRASFQGILGSTADLGIVSSEGELLRRLTLAVNSRFVRPSVAANGKRLLATNETRQHEVWKVPLGPDPETNGKNAVRLLDSSGDPFWTQVSRDGSTLLFNSTAAGSRNLWTMPVDGRAPQRQITFLSGNAPTHSALSPDGSRVAYASHQTGVSKIWTANIDGSNAVPLTDGASPDFWPAWSPDGKWIAFGSIRGGEPQLWKVASRGGAAEKITREGGFRGDWSPVDNRIVFWKAGQLQVAEVDSGRVLLKIPAGDLTWTLPVWSPDGRYFSAMREEAHESSSLWLFDAKTGERRLVAKLPAGFHTLFRAAWSGDARFLIVNRDKTISHIVLLENF